MANSVDLDQTPHSAMSDLGLHYLQRPSGHYGTFFSNGQQRLTIRLYGYAGCSESLLDAHV